MKIWLALLVIFSSMDGLSFYGAYLRPYLVPVILILASYLINFKFKRRFLIRFYYEDIFLFGIIFLILVAALVNPTVKSINYIFAYMVILFFYYICIKYVAINLNISNYLIKINYYAVFLISVLAILEFYFFYLYELNLQELIKYIKVNPIKSGALESLTESLRVKRSYVFSDEPTTLAYYFGTLGPLAIWHSWSCNRAIYKYLYLIVFVAAFFTTFSGAAIISILLSAILFSMITLIQKLTLKKIIIFLMLLSFIGFVISTSYLNTSNFEIGVFNKISNLMESKRFGTIIHALNDVNSNPVFGVGLGQYSIDGVNIISWYALLAAETGIFTLLLLFFFFVSVIHRIVSNQNIPGAHVFLYSFLYGIFHLATTPTFFAPALWLLLIIYYSHLTQSKKIEFIRERFSHE